MTRILFMPMTVYENIDIVKWSYFSEDLNLKNNTVRMFPKLASIQKNLTQEQIGKIIEKVVIESYDIDKLKFESDRYNRLWERYNDAYMDTISSYLNIQWPNKNILCRIGMIPISPRNIQGFYFATTMGMTNENILKVCAHESLHFIWFEKFKTIYPEIPEEQYDSPHIPWKYSEMVVDPILNSRSLQSIVPVPSKAYDYFYTLKDDNSSVMGNLNYIYSKDATVETKISEGFEYVKTYYNKNKKIK